MKNKKLIIEFKNSRLNLLTYQADHLVDSTQILVREMPEAMVREKVSVFLQQTKPKEQLLILSRSETVQKELIVSKAAKETIKSKIASALPYSAHEMVHGISMKESENGLTGMLLAMRESHLQRILEELKGFGLTPNEIVTEDQCLLWYALAVKEESCALLLDFQEERMLAVYVQKGRMKFSRAFAKSAYQEEWDLDDILHEISLSLMEHSAKASKVFVSGAWTAQTQMNLQDFFGVTVTRVDPSPQACPSHTLWAARYFGKYPLISLLPHKQKLARWKNKKKKLLTHAALSALALFASMFLAFSLHALFQKSEIRNLRNRIEHLLPEASASKKILASLNLLKQSQSSKAALLAAILSMSEGMPPQVEYQEILFGGDNFLFKGESLSHTYLIQTVQAVENAGIEDARLEHTRLRKRLGQDYYEFEVVGKWTGSEINL